MTDDEYLERLGAVLGEQKTERDFLKLCGLYRKGTPAQREFVRSAWTPRVKWKVPKVTDFPLRNPLAHAERIAGALIRDSIENARMDWRDTLVGFAAAWHVAGLLGLDPARLFEDVASFSTPEFAELLRDFARRRPEDRSLEAFAWIDCSTPDRVLLRPGG
jgi:hypothetical protein